MIKDACRTPQFVIFAGLAASGCGLPLLLSVVGRVAPEEKRSAWLGITAAGGTGGRFFLVPLNRFLISTIGGVAALLHRPIDDRPVERLAQEQTA